MAKRVTIKSIAQDLGISHMTVSRALSDNPNVQPKTRQMIKQRAQELGYVKSAVATAMRGERSKIVGLLLPNLVNEFYAQFSNTLTQHCEEHGLQLIIHLSNDEQAKEERALLQLREVQAGAVVLVPSPGNADIQPHLLQDLSIVHLIRQRAGVTPAAAMLIDDSAAIAQAVMHLQQQGHTTIGFIGADVSLSSGEERLAAFTNAMLAVGLKIGEGQVITRTPSFDMGRKAALELIANKSVSALICAGVEISNGALNGCLSANVKFPTQMAFIGYGDPSFYQWIDKGISTIKLPVDELAIQTAQYLAHKLTGRKVEEYKTELSAKLIVRRSSMNR